MDEFANENAGAGAAEAPAANLTSLFAKLRSKYPELADEPLLDQAEAAASGEPEPAEDQAMELDMEAPMPEEADAGDDSIPFGDGQGGVVEPKAPKGKRKRLKAPPMPDLEAADESAPVNGGY